MSHRFSPRLVLTGLIATIPITPVAAQHNSRDAAAYPCAPRALAIVPDAHGFSIRREPTDTSPRGSTALPPVPLGVRVKIDTALFAGNAARTPEASDASPR